jgi:hypothetical protein
MNGYHPSTNFVGALGEYPIYDYIDNTSNNITNYIKYSSNDVSKYIYSIKQLIDGTSNTKIDSRFFIKML